MRSLSDSWRCTGCRTGSGEASLSIRSSRSVPRGPLGVGARRVKELILIFLIATWSASAYGADVLTVCSQNLDNFGLPETDKLREPRSPKEHEVKRLALLKRFKTAECDVIALQEIISKSPEEGESVLHHLVEGSTMQAFNAVAGESQDPVARVGFLVNEDKGRVVESASYADRELPKLSRHAPPRLFARGPLRVDLRLNFGTVIILTLFNFHFKSKFGSANDPAKRGWETHRMESAEALHQLASELSKRPTILLGDRNSGPAAASSRILSGEILLKNFQSPDACLVSKGGIAHCSRAVRINSPRFRTVFSQADRKELKGSHKYREKFEWIDEISVSANVFGKQLKTKRVGVIHDWPEASDHGLVYATFEEDFKT